MEIYSTRSKKKQLLKPKKGKKLHIFVCGITPYDFSHIGHARTYIAFDMIAKYLRQQGYDVDYLQNVTDIDDKIIKRAKETGEEALELSHRFEKKYMEDMKSLKVGAVSTYARATDYISEILSQVERMLEKGYAYEIEGDGVYFDISKFKEYGKLSGRKAEQAEDAVSRIDESVGKRNKGDFALWKLAPRSPKGEVEFEPSWPSPWGEGRPGWHIEDTAITEKFFGAQYDIHGGARDLIFPHHEAEIAQMESISGKEPLVNYWMHTGFLTVNGEKMSKSLGNFITIRDFLEKHPARLLRFFVLKTHYRSPIDYSEELLKQAQNELQRIDDFIDKLDVRNQVTHTPRASELLSRAKQQIEKAMEDDLNTPLAMSILFELIREGNTLLGKEELDKQDAREVLDFLKQIDEYFGCIFWGREKQEVPEEIKKLADQREKYRKEENWAKSDELRDALVAKGWIVEDTPSGYKLKKLV
jgi:cysteinyl-tRNA synthetase